MLTFIFKISNLHLHQNLYLLLSSVSLPSSTFETSYDESQHGQSKWPLFVPFLSSWRLASSPLSCICSQGKFERSADKCRHTVCSFGNCRHTVCSFGLGRAGLTWFSPSLWMPNFAFLQCDSCHLNLCYFLSNRIIMNSDKVFAIIKAF